MSELTQERVELTELNRGVVERLFQAGKDLDIVTIFEQFDPNVAMHVPPGLPHSGTHVGIEGISEALVPLAEIFDLTEVECEARIADGDRVVMLINLPLRKGGSVQLAECYRLDAGKIVEIRVFYWDTTVVA